MPIKDVLWACPLCHRIEGLDLDGRCRECGAVFQRSSGARIRARQGGEPGPEHTAGEWLARLPWPDLDGEGDGLPAGLEPPFRQTVHLRTAGAELPLRRAGAFLGSIERFGRPAVGQLTLLEASLGFVPDAKQERIADPPAPWEWPLAELTAIQPASSAIQLKARGRPVVSVRFTEGSVRLWEQRLKYCARLAWRAAGRGEIREFQPRIRSR